MVISQLHKVGEHTAPVVGDPDAGGAVGRRLAVHLNPGTVALEVAVQSGSADQAHGRASVARVDGAHRRRVGEVVVDSRWTPIVACCTQIRAALVID